MDQADRRHGRYAGYLAGCKTRTQCPATPTCVDAERRYQNARARDIAYGRPRKVPAIGSVRRIQALMRIGWSGTYLCERLDLRRPNLPVYTRYPTVRTATADKIKALYEELVAADVAGPSERTAARAAVMGFLPPAAWEGVYMDDPDALPVFDWQDDTGAVSADVDVIAIERACSGEPVKLSRAEKLEAVRVLLERRLTPTQIAERLRLNGTTANRLVAKAQTQGGREEAA